MIKPKKFKCVICHKTSKGYGNNAQPVKVGICCDNCNEDVIMERLRQVEERENENSN